MQDKTHFEGQMQRVFKAFLSEPKTMRMVATETDIVRSNITRYVDCWRKLGSIQLVKIGRCPITGYSYVGFYTTDKSKFSEPLQLPLFK